MKTLNSLSDSAIKYIETKTKEICQDKNKSRIRLEDALIEYLKDSFSNLVITIMDSKNRKKVKVIINYGSSPRKRTILEVEL